MKAIWLLLFCVLCAAGCKSSTDKPSAAPEAAPAWHDSYFANPLSAGETFHSEIVLSAGEKHELAVESKDEVRVGFTLEKGFEIFKSKGSVWMGTHIKPHTVGGAPGVSFKFAPENGTVHLIVENDSPIETRIAFYTKPASSE